MGIDRVRDELFKKRFEDEDEEDEDDENDDED